MKISLITATYNSASTLNDTFNSVLSLDYTNYEYIVIDGGSKDGTLDIISEYAPKFDGRMRWISEPDNGIYDAMNKGIAMATGNIIGILNSDDFFTSSNILSKVAENIEDVDAVYGDIHFVSPDNLTKSIRYYSSERFSPWQMRMGFMPAHPSFYCKKEVYDKYGVFNTSFKIAADFELLLRFIFVNRIKTRYIPLDFVTMRTGGASTSGLKSHKQILSDHLRAYRENNVHSNIIFESFRYLYKGLRLLPNKVASLF